MTQESPSVALQWKPQMTGHQLGLFFRVQSINRLPENQRPEAIRGLINNW